MLKKRQFVKKDSFSSSRVGEAFSSGSKTGRATDKNYSGFLGAKGWARGGNENRHRKFKRSGHIYPI